MTNTNGIDAQKYAQTAYDVVAPAVKKALDEPERGESPRRRVRALRRALRQLARGRANVFPWDDGLALLPTPSEKPLGDAS